MIPITKNIDVINEAGDVLESTYPKRAKGLVKNGRARYVSDNMICILACPPNILGDTQMDDKIEPIVAIEPIEPVNITQPSEKLSMNYVLEQIEKIAVQTEYLNYAIGKIGDAANILEDNDRTAESLANIVHSREATNQQLLKLYEKMYDGLKPQKVMVSETSNEVNTFKQLAEALINYPPNVAETILMRSAQQIFVKAGAEIVK